MIRHVATLPARPLPPAAIQPGNFLSPRRIDVILSHSAYSIGTLESHAMSTVDVIDISCPRCGQARRGKVARSIAGNRATSMAQQARTGTLHLVHCLPCNHSFYVESYFSYTDFEQGVHVAVAPMHLQVHAPMLVHDAASTFEDAFAQTQHVKIKRQRDAIKCRMVFGLSALREKLLLWDRGLDDRQVEVAKAQLVAAIHGRADAITLTFYRMTPSGVFCYRGAANAMLKAPPTPRPLYFIRRHDLAAVASTAANYEHDWLIGVPWLTMGNPQARIAP